MKPIWPLAAARPLPTQRMNVVGHASCETQAHCAHDATAGAGQDGSETHVVVARPLPPIRIASHAHVETHMASARINAGAGPR